MNQKRVLVAVAAVSIGIVVGTLFKGLAGDLSTPPAPAPSGIASTSFDAHQRAALERRNDALQKCRQMGQRAAVGFGRNGPSVLCLQAPSIAFELDPEWPE